MSGEGEAEVSNQEGRGAFGDYVVYVDESGDPNPLSVSAEYPIFVLAFCIFKVSDYVNQVVPAMHALKFKYFGYDGVIFHERDNRKNVGIFQPLRMSSFRTKLLGDIGKFIENAEFTLIAVVLEKGETIKGSSAQDLYLKTFQTGIRQVEKYLNNKQSQTTTFVVFESRGRSEDRIFLKAFHESKTKNSNQVRGTELTLKPVEKLANTVGLQIADLVARPIGNYVLKNFQVSRAVAHIWPKIRSGPSGEVKDWGIFVIPKTRSP